MPLVTHRFHAGFPSLPREKELAEVALLLCEMAERTDRRGMYVPSPPADSSFRSYRDLLNITLPSLHSDPHPDIFDLPPYRHDVVDTGSETGLDNITRSKRPLCHNSSSSSSSASSYTCEDCGKVLACRSSLRQHVYMHKDSRPYLCDLCPKRFNHRTTLRTHRRLHTGAAPYTCTSCSRSFTDYSTLVKHHRTHSGSKPYCCQYCNKAFSQSGNRHRHARKCRLSHQQ